MKKKSYIKRGLTGL